MSCAVPSRRGGPRAWPPSSERHLPPLAASCGAPPDIPNARLFGRKRPRYETDSLVRYYCVGGFVQTLSPVVRCLPGGQWEKPLITCRPREWCHVTHV